jgi:hypothetical protein
LDKKKYKILCYKIMVFMITQMKKIKNNNIKKKHLKKKFKEEKKLWRKLKIELSKSFDLNRLINTKIALSLNLHYFIILINKSTLILKITKIPFELIHILVLKVKSLDVYFLTAGIHPISHFWNFKVSTIKSWWRY